MVAKGRRTTLPQPMKPTTYRHAIAELKVTTVRVCEPQVVIGDAPHKIADLWKKEVTKSDWFDPDKEALVVFTFNTRLRCTGFFLVALGTLNETCAHPRDILKPAIAASAYTFAIAHNHPSGDPSPSEADRKLTRRIREAGELLGIALLDHVIIGEPAPDRALPYFSFRECGLI